MKVAEQPSLKVALISLVIFILDQITKLAILDAIFPGELVEIIPNYFNLTLHFNYGAAFGLFAATASPWREILLTVTTILALGCVIYFVGTGYAKSALGQISLGFILGGAFGNVCDRVARGKVVDFLDFYYRDWHWPAFNVADSAICVGVMLLFFVRPDHPSESETKILNPPN